jgi:hypothetical protein
LTAIKALAAEIGASEEIEGERAAFAELVEAVIVHPVPPREKLDIEITGRLGVLLQAPLPPAGRHSG